jgi:hypothetical protein
MMLMTCNLEGTSLEAFMKVINKKITGIALAGAVDSDHKDELHIRLGQQYIRITDSGQSCCESRYMTCDDKLEDHVGATLLNIEVREMPIPVLERTGDDDDGECHEINYVVVTTSAGEIVLVNHNEHNGYYGGIDVGVTYGVVA